MHASWKYLVTFLLRWGSVISGNVILTGASGILGSAFISHLAAHSVVCLNRTDLDCNNLDGVFRRIVQLKPSLVINCAADTDVEAAEINPEPAFAVNATLAGLIARAAAAAGAPMLHFSSTGCYGNWKDTPYEESDPLRPTTVHHASKARGEEEVLLANRSALVMRLGWVYGGGPGQRKNFVWARILEARGKELIGSNPFRIGCPTFAGDVVRQALLCMQERVSGIVNCVGAGPPASRLDYVEAILSASGSDTRVMPVAFPRKAPVSPNEAATNTRLHFLGIETMPPWRATLVTFVRSLLGSSLTC
jgi:dTDP-4-dehydrorhamnose reductase